MTRITVNIPEGTSGDFEVAHYTNTTTDKQWQLYLEMKNESNLNYCVLLQNGCPMPIMQDSEGEYREHQWLWDKATGHVLIGGLGIGMVNVALLTNPNVTSVTIIENSQDVINLVWPHCASTVIIALASIVLVPKLICPVVAFINAIVVLVPSLFENTYM